MGRLIPAGTGMVRYRSIGIQIEAPEGALDALEEEDAVRPAASSPAATEGYLAAPARSPGEIET